MNLEEIVSTMLNGEPIHDSIIIGTIFIVFMAFYGAIYGAMFSIFNKNK